MSIAVFTLSCKESALITYPEGENSVYFGVENTNKGNKNKYIDTTRFSFAELPTTTKDAVITLSVNALGVVADYDRRFDYSIMKEGTTGVEGTDFERVSGATVIKAGQVNGIIRLKLKRAKGQVTTAVNIRLQLLENEEFALEMKRETIDAINNKYINLIEHTVVCADFVSEPARWVQHGSLGVFSSDKYVYVSKLCNLTAADWERSMGPSERDAIWVRTRNALQAEINKGLEYAVKERLPNGTTQYMRVSGLVGLPQVG